jgi:predicted ester cyclase
MSEENKAIVIHLYEELDKNNFGIYSELTTPDYLGHFPGRTQPMNREEREQFSRMFYKAFPDGRHSVDDLVAEGDKVAARLTARGTHQGEFQGVSPTGEAISFTGMRVFRIVGDKIAEEWANLDMLGLMQQIGAVLTSAPKKDKQKLSDYQRLNSSMKSVTSEAKWTGSSQ